MEVSGSEWGSVVWSCAHSNETSGSTEGGEFLDLLSSTLLLKKSSAPPSSVTYIKTQSLKYRLLYYGFIFYLTWAWDLAWALYRGDFLPLPDNEARPSRWQLIAHVFQDFNYRKGTLVLFKMFVNTHVSSVCSFKMNTS